MAFGNGFPVDPCAGVRRLGLFEYLVTSLRPNGPIFDPSSFVVICNLMFSLLLSIVLRTDYGRSRVSDWMTLVVLAVLALGVLSGHSRAGTVLFLLASGWVVVCLGWARFRHSTGPTFRSLVAVAAIIVAGFVFVSGDAG